MKKISLLFFLLSFSTFFSTFLYAWDWPQCRNTNGGDPEQPSTVYLGDKSLTFGHDSWATVNDKWPKWRMWISTDASLTSGTGSQSSEWSGYSNVEHKTSSSPQFTSTGTWYWGVQVEYTDADGTTGWYCRNEKNWNNMWGTPTSTLTITVDTLNKPSNQAAAFTASTTVHLTWSKDAQGHNVMIVRYAKDATPTAPTNGTAYSVGSTLGSGDNQGTVVYNSSGTSYDDTGVTSGNNYDYYFYSENNSYYSSGMKATADYKWTWQGNTSTDWGTASNWVGGSVPTASDDVFIPSGCTYYPTVSSGAVAKSITINSGATLNGGSNTLTVSGNFTNNGTFNAGTGTIVFDAVATVSGTVTFNNLTISKNFTPSTNTTINGTFSLNSGYNVLTNAPKYGSSSTLKYNCGGTPGRSTEWSATGVGTIGTTAGYPNNVTVSNNTTLNCNNGSTDARAMSGSLTIESGSNLYCDYSGGSCALTVSKDITMNGNFSLGGSDGGDLTVGGNFTKSGGDFNTNGRVVTFNGTSTQTISGSGLNSESGNINCFPYLTINNGTGGSVTLSTPVTVTNTLTLTKGVVTTSSSNILYVSNSGAGSISGGSSDSYINGPFKRAFSSGTASDWIFPVGKNSTFLPCMVNTPTGTSPLTVEAYDSNCGGTGSGYTLSSTEYWYMSGNTLTAGTVSLAKSGTSCTVVMYSSTANGTYTSLDGSSTTVCSVTGVKATNSVNPLTPNYFVLATLANYYFRSKNSSGTWATASDWEYSTDNQNWSTSSIVPGDNALGIIIQPDHTISVSSAVYSSNCTVNGTLEIQNGGSLSHAPTFGSGSILKYNTGTSSVPGAEWKPNVTSGAGYPCHIQIASGTLQMSVASFANKYYAAGNVTIASGATLDFNMAYDSNVAEHQGKPVVIVNGDITNDGTIYFANSTGGGNLAFQCKTMTNAGTLSLSENTSAPLQAIGGDMKLTGDFINNGTFNCNGRAIVFTDSANQKIDGSTGGPYAIDFMVLDKSGGQVTLYKDVTCEGYSTNGGGYWALSLSGGTLVLNGKTLEISATDPDLTTNKGRAGVQCVNGGKIMGDKDATVKLLGNYTQWTASSGQSLIFDQTKNGVTNVLKDLTINRIDSAGLSDTITINNIIIDHLLDIQAGKVEVSNHLGLDTAAVGRLSSTYTTASLKVKKLILGKSPLHAAEFYRNGRTLTIDDKVMVKVHFYHIAQWNFFAFPFPITQILKADTTTTATWNTDYSVGIYDPVRRANRTSGWKTLTNVTTLKADTGYIINKKGSVADLFFVTNAKSDDESFGNPSSSSPVYTGVSYTIVSGGLTCNFGWNFVSQPLVVKATSSLSNGQFAYSYNPANDAYKLYYGSDNPGYTYGGSASLVPYEAFFVKTAAAGNMGSYITSPQGVRRRTDAQPEDVVQLNLAANGNNYETLVRMLPQSTAGYDELYDAPYSDPMNAATPRIYTLSSGSSYALALNTVPEETTVPVYVKVPQAGDYSFNWTTQLTNLPVTLTDQQTGETVDLTTETEYAFQTSTPEMKNRFFLNVPKRVITENTNIENTDHFLRIYPQKGNIVIDGLKGSSQIYVSDMAGRVLQAKTTADSHCTLAIPTSGLYVIVIRDEQHSNYRTKMLVW